MTQAVITKEANKFLASLEDLGSGLLPLFPELETYKDHSSAYIVLDGKKKASAFAQVAVLTSFEAMSNSDLDAFATEHKISVQSIKDKVAVGKVFTRVPLSASLSYTHHLFLAKARETGKIDDQELAQIMRKAENEGWTADKLKEYLNDYGKVITATGKSDTKTQVKFTYRTMVENEKLEVYLAGLQESFDNWLVEYRSELEGHAGQNYEDTDGNEYN